MNSPQAILITGASSGIGAALARVYAAPNVSLALVARNQKRLETVAHDCRRAGASVHTGQIDVNDRKELKSFIRATDDRAPIELVIANAGIVGHNAQGVDDEERSRRILETNLSGKLNTIYPIIPSMVRRGLGQIAVMSSVKGFHGAATLCTFQAAMAGSRIFGDTLRHALSPYGINVSVIIPGPVITPMTEHLYAPGFGVIDAENAALRIKAGLARNSAHIGFPLLSYLRHRLTSFLPMPVMQSLLKIRGRKTTLEIGKDNRLQSKFVGDQKT